MENKYYTPELHEFHIGFQYEAKSNGNYVYINKHDEPNWKLQTFSGGFLNDEGSEVDAIEKELKNNNIRVKHLDREDIESFGFVKHKTIDNYWKLNEHVLRLKNSKISIYIYDEYTIDRLIFEGTIKNKSELRKLMQQLNINSGGK